MSDAALLPAGPQGDTSLASQNLGVQRWPALPGHLPERAVGPSAPFPASSRVAVTAHVWRPKPQPLLPCDLSLWVGTGEGHSALLPQALASDVRSGVAAGVRTWV